MQYTIAWCSSDTIYNLNNYNNCTVIVCFGIYHVPVLVSVVNSMG